MYNNQPKRTIVFNTEPILNDIDNIVKDGLTKLLGQYLNRYELLERTHQAIMNLPSVVHELANRTESNNFLSPVIEEKQNEKDLQAMISANENLLARVDILSKENEELTNELRELKKQLFHHTTDLSFDEVQIKVEPGLTVDSVEKENIKLEIEEQDVQDEEEDDSDSQQEDADEEEENVNEEDADEEEEDVDESDNAEDILETDEADETDDVLEAQHVQEEVVEEHDEQEEVVEEDDEQEEVVEEDDEQEEVVEEDDVQEEVVEEDDEQEGEESVETEKSDSEEEQDEEEEDIFEIDIDDVTYCTNNEENGFIYELKDGEMGDKIGYFKDGEPFFYADEN
jgi:hypothetical protein